MSLTFIVDGYNVINRSQHFRDKESREARAAFLAFLDSRRPHGSTRNRLIVVFDGSQEVVGFRYDCSFDVIFSKGGSADDKIIDLVNKSQSPKNIVVVTDDKGIISLVRPKGVKVMSVLEFLEVRKKTKAVSLEAEHRSEPKIDLNIVQREAITEELKNIWLKKKSS